jgi:hypothetical protein
VRGKPCGAATAATASATTNAAVGITAAVVAERAAR